MKRSIIFCCLGFLSLLLPAQTPVKNNFIQLTEIKSKVKEDERRDLPNSGFAIVDINSRIEVRIDRDSLKKAIDQFLPERRNLIRLEEKQQALRQSLENQKRIYDLLEQQQIDKQDKIKVQDLLIQLLDVINSNPDLAEDVDAYFLEFAAGQPGAGQDKFFIYLMDKLNADLRELTAEIKALREQSKVNFSLSARKADRSGAAIRVHIDNFDLYERGEFFNVDRWVYRITEEQELELQALGALSNELNQNSAKLFGDWLELAQRSVPPLAVIVHLPDTLNKIRETFEGELAPNLREVLNQKIEEAKQLSRTSSVLENKIGNWSVAAPYNAAAGLLDFAQQLKNFKTSLKADLVETVNQSTFKATIDRQIGLLTQLYDQLGQWQQAIVQVVQSQRDHLASDSLTKEILAFELDNVPAQGLIELQYTGRRASGEELVLDAYARVRDSENPEKESNHLLLRRRMEMVLTGAHSITKLGLVLANPIRYQLPSNAKQEFLFTPGGTLLLKFGSRKSHFYNNFLDPGIGINAASPDFNLDGTPEFSAGITGTLFKDIFSIGWNWNFGVNKPLYFLGFHLPFNLPGLPVNTINNQEPPGE